MGKLPPVQPSAANLTSHPRGVIYSIIFHRLQPTIGFAWATRVIGFMELTTLLIPLSVMRVRILPPKARNLVDWSAFSDLPYMTYVLGTLVGYMGLCG